MEHMPHDFLSTPEGLAHRFDRPPVHYPYRSLGFRGDRVPDDRPGMEGKLRYDNVEYKVEFTPEPGKPATDGWSRSLETRGFGNLLTVDGEDIDG